MSISCVVAPLGRGARIALTAASVALALSASIVAAPTAMAAPLPSTTTDLLGRPSSQTNPNPGAPSTAGSQTGINPGGPSMVSTLKPDLVAWTGYTEAPNHPHGAADVVGGEVVNQGVVDSGPFVFRITVPDAYEFRAVRADSGYRCSTSPLMFAHATLVECSHPALAPNVEAVVRIDVINPHEAGSYPILMTVDPDNTVAESNEGNNSYTDKHVIP